MLQLRLRAKAPLQFRGESPVAVVPSALVRGAQYTYDASAPATLRTGGAFEAVLTGPEAMHWHDGFIAQYPSAAAFFEMIKDPEYQKAVVNRTAALADSRLVRFKPGAMGEGF